MAPFDMSGEERALVTRVIENLGNRALLDEILLVNGDTIDKVASSELRLGRIAHGLIGAYCLDPPRLHKFVDEFCRKQPAIDELTALGALSRRVAQHIALAPVVSALETLGAASDPDLRALVIAAKDDLVEVERRLLVLSYSKEMHDKLHELQTQAYDEIQRVGLSDNPISDAELANVDTQCRAIERFLADAWAILPSLERAPQGIGATAWLDSIEDVLALLRGPRGHKEIRAALFRLRTVLRQHLPRFEAAIVETADAVPFNQAIALLRDAARHPQSPGDVIATVEVAATRLADLEKELKAMIALHRSWQFVDRELWDVESLLPAVGGDVSMTDVELSWRGVARLLAGIKTAQPARWNDELDTAIGQTSAAVSGSAEDHDNRLARIAATIRKLRLAFVEVDKALRVQCLKISSLRGPILKMVEVGDGR